jgi:hypothetical protein
MEEAPGRGRSGCLTKVGTRGDMLFLWGSTTKIGVAGANRAPRGAELEEETEEEEEEEEY